MNDTPDTHPPIKAVFRDWRRVRLPDRFDDQFVDDVTMIETFDCLVEYLRNLYRIRSNKLADRNYRKPSNQRLNLENVGGFCTHFTHWLGTTMEAAWSKKYFLIFQHIPNGILQPEQTSFPESETEIDFWLHGCNHTPFYPHELVDRVEFMRLLRAWYDTGDMRNNPMDTKRRIDRLDF